MATNTLVFYNSNLHKQFQTCVKFMLTKFTATHNVQYGEIFTVAVQLVFTASSCAGFILLNCSVGGYPNFYFFFNSNSLLGFVHTNLQAIYYICSAYS